MNTFVSNARIVFPGDRIALTSIRFADGKVAAIGHAAPEAGDAVVDAGGRLLTPGLIDLHVHGIHRFNFDNGPADGPNTTGGSTLPIIFSRVVP